MDKYTVNGKTVEYDTFDVLNLEVYQEALDALHSAAAAPSITGENFIQQIRRQAEAVYDFFDTILGDGAATDIFDGRMNIQTLVSAVKEFTDAVNQRVSALGDDLHAQNAKNVPANRQQRREAERAAVRAAVRNAATLRVKHAETV